MKAQNNKLQITDIFEIKLELQTWKKLQKIAQKHRISYSWATRLCLLQILKIQKQRHREKILHFRYIFKLQAGNPTQKIEMHRHKLCLYGDDAIRVRILAAKWGSTISALVRLAIDVYLSLLDHPLTENFLVKNGIKILASVVEKHDVYEKVYFLSVDYRPFRPCFGRFWF